MEGSGLPIRISTIELIEIGAGGGSIARADALGLLKVGPDSAGSEPGPACYGRGGTQPTVTDANLLLGYLNADFFAGGTMTIDPARAQAAVQALADAGRARDGAGGGRHPRRGQRGDGRRGARAHRRARPRPARLRAADDRRRRPGAWLRRRAQAGAAPADLPAIARRRLGLGPAGGAGAGRPGGGDQLSVADGDLAALERSYAALERAARAVLAQTGVPTEAARVQRLADGRFVGQGYELTVKLPPGPYDGRRRGRRCWRRSRRRTGPSSPARRRMWSWSSWRRASPLQAAIAGGRIAPLAADPDVGRAQRGARLAWFAEAGGFVRTPVYDRDRMRARHGVRGARAGRGCRVDPGGRVRQRRCRVTAHGSIIVELLQEGGDDRWLDAVTIEVLWSRIISIVDEAAKVIARTAFSTLSNEANDFACVLTDARGRSLAQNTSGIPSFIATLPATVRHMLDAFPAAEMRAGDIYITNDPWQGTGHLPDICLVRPIFAGDTLVAFSATTSHVPDIGGAVRSAAPRELYEEGLHIPPMRFMRERRARRADPAVHRSERPHPGADDGRHLGAGLGQ